MGFRFRRTFSLLPGIRLNLGATGPSISVGPKGAKLTLDQSGLRATGGVPGTGMFVTQKVAGWHTSEHKAELPSEIQQLISDRPQHWEFLLLQQALRSAADDINSMAAALSTCGTDAITFCQWIGSVLQEIEELAVDWNGVMNGQMPQALGLAGKPADPDLLVETIDRLISLTRMAVEYEQRVSALARHPLYGDLAKAVGKIGEPFVDVCNDLPGRLDDQLPNFAATHELDLQVKLKPPTTPESYAEAQEAFRQRFFDGTYNLRMGDVITDRFLIARGEKQVGEFSRSAITDNLAAGIFLKDDSFWSIDAQGWRPLNSLPL